MGKGKIPPAIPRRDHLLAELADPAFAAAYLNAAARESDAAAFLQALRNVVEAIGGVAAIASRTDLNRQAVYRMLSESGNPEFRSLQRLLGAAGLGLSVQVADQAAGEYSVRRKAAAKSKSKRRVKRVPVKLAA
jgi:probable addiction module antidote protein